MTRRQLAFYGALSCAAVVLIDSQLRPHVEFTTDVWNSRAVSIVLLLPIVMAIAGPPIVIARRRRRVAAATALWLLAAIGALGSMRACAEPLLHFAIGLEEPTFLSTGRYTIAVYQWGGAGSYGGGVVDQVCRLGPGVVYERLLYLQGHGAHDVEVRVVDPDHIQVNAVTVALRPLVWPFC